MKTKLTLFVAVIAVSLFGTGCASSRVSVIDVNDVIGTYEFNDANRDGVQWRMIFHENGSIQRWSNGVLQPPATWRIEKQYIHISFKNGSKKVCILTANSLKTIKHISQNGDENIGFGKWKLNEYLKVENSSRVSVIDVNDVIGTYEFKDPIREGVSWRFIFHENGTIQRWANDTLQPPASWKVEDGKVRISWMNGTTGIWTRRMLESFAAD